MTVTLREGSRRLWLGFWWDLAVPGERISFGDHLAARQLLARLGAGGHLPSLRRLCAGALPGARLDDHEVIEQLAWRLVSGQLRVVSSPVEWLSSFGDKEEEAPSEPAWDARPEQVEAPPMPVVGEALPPKGVDASRQTAALRRAAARAMPFCEECVEAKAEPPPAPEDTAGIDQAAQADTLIRAARAGAPFCEECGEAMRARGAEVSDD